MLKHASTNVHNMLVDKMFPTCASSSCRHGLAALNAQRPLSHRGSNWSSATSQCHLCLTVYVTPGLGEGTPCFGCNCKWGSEAQLVTIASTTTLASRESEAQLIPTS